MPPLRNRVAALRLQRGLQQQALAAQLAVSRQALSAIEAGRSGPSTELALRLARVLDCRVEDLFTLDDDEAVVAELAATSTDADGDRGATRRVALASIDGRWIAHPLALDADGATSVAADGLITGRVRGGSARRRVVVLADRDRLRERVIIAGCAPALGVLAARAGELRGGPRVTWIERSSTEALALLERGHVHIAGIHLLDESSGDYNVAVARRLVPDRALRLFRLARWDAGLVVRRGNPRRIRTVRDLARPGVTMVRRDAGTGAEALLLRLARDAGLDAAGIGGRGAARVGSHLEVARAVALGVADTGIAIESVALALGLDFIPLAEERFDLVIGRGLADDPRLVRVLDTLAGRTFRRELESLGGHRATETGDLIADIAGAP